MVGQALSQNESLHGIGQPNQSPPLFSFPSLKLDDPVYCLSENTEGINDMKTTRY